MKITNKFSKDRVEASLHDIFLPEVILNHFMGMGLRKLGLCSFLNCPPPGEGLSPPVNKGSSFLKKLIFLIHLFEDFLAV